MGSSVPGPVYAAEAGDGVSLSQAVGLYDLQIFAVLEIPIYEDREQGSPVPASSSGADFSRP